MRFSNHPNPFGSTTQIEIYSKAGTVDQNPQGTSGWELMCSSEVQGKGFGQRTDIPEGDCKSVEVDMNEFRTFYVTMVDVNDMVVAQGSKSDGLNNGDLTLRPGSAVTYFDTQRFNGYVFDGGIRYNVITESSGGGNGCRDQTGNVYIHESVGERSCSWLKDNIARFGFACNLVVPAFHCAATCGICGTSELLL